MDNSIIRKDYKGQKLRTGEGYRKDRELYFYRYTDKKKGKRRTIYDKDLVSLREREDKILIGLGDPGKKADALKLVTLNDAFAAWLKLSPKQKQTKENLLRLWKNHVANDIGEYKIAYIRSSDIKEFYNRLAKRGLSKSTIKIYRGILTGTFDLLVDDDILAKNPASRAFSGQGKAPVKREALTIDAQEKLLAYIEESTIYKKHVPLIKIMLNTALRCGELIGLTWSDVDFDKRVLKVDHQLIYKDIGDGYQFYNVLPKTDCGKRVIPISNETVQLFKEQKKINLLLGVDSSLQTAGLRGFVFTSKGGTPIMPATLNAILYNIVSSYNKKETKRAESEGRCPELLPKFSAHVLRHTACTRLAERGMQAKALQVYMGHADYSTTMNVYTHIESINTLRSEYEHVFDVGGENMEQVVHE
ncbi:MAG: site-specific integrase [Lachnospiraceae bacterium]|nr:site-specific integrase [Lachnospiraceae bacterium]